MTKNETDILSKHMSKVPVNLGLLAKELGIDVFQASLKPGISGLIEPSETSESGYLIRLNRHEVIERQRFTLAHEISHFLLHRYDIGGGVVDDTMYRSSLSSRKEVEANKLASSIIMPSNSINLIRNEYMNHPVDYMVDEMAKRFRVSKPAMRIRLGV